MGLPLLPTLWRVAVVAVGSVSGVGTVYTGWELAWNRIKRRRHLYRLSASEKKLLHQFVDTDNPVQYFNPNQFVSTSLLDLSIIFLANEHEAYSAAAKGGHYYYGIHEPSFHFLKKHRKLLK